MSDKAKIIGGLAVFLVLALFPIWYALGSAQDASAHKPDPPSEGKCVEDSQYMTRNHMNLLNEWRDAVIRDGQKEHTSKSGENKSKKYDMSLTGTCMSCHSNRETFCQRCHDYADVQPTCWQCHVEEKGN